MLPTKFRFIWPNVFREEDFKQISQSEKRIACGGHVCKWIGKKYSIFRDNRSQMFPTKFCFIRPNGFRGEEFKKSANHKKESPVAVMFVNGSGRNEQSLQMTFHRCFLPSFGSFGQAVAEEKIVKNRPIRNNNCLWRPCL